MEADLLWSLVQQVLEQGELPGACTACYKASNAYRPCVLGSGQIKLSMVHVEDLADAIVIATERPSTGETYFVSNDEGYSWKEIGQSIKRALNKTYMLKLKLPVG